MTQGTVEKDVEKLIMPALDALIDTDTLVIVTTGGSMTDWLRDKYQAPNVIIEDFIPYAQLMPHVDVYITNGGYGGVMLGIEHELPMIVAGVHEGKNEICARVGHFKIGINLKTESPTAAQIRKALHLLASDADYQKNVSRLAARIRQYPTLQLFAGDVAEALAAAAQPLSAQKALKTA